MQDSKPVNMKSSFERIESPSEILTKDADYHFDLEWLRKRLFEYHHNALSSFKNVKGANYSYPFSGTAELKFATSFLLYCDRSNLDEVKSTAIDLFDGENPRLKLMKERRELIIELTAIPFARNWVNVGSRNPRSWEIFARKADLSKRDEREYEEFFKLIDHISIITDFLNFKAKSFYGIDFDPSLYDKPVAELTLQILTAAINDCKTYLTKSSHWAAVYRMLEEDCKKMEVNGVNIIKNYAQFEKFVCVGGDWRKETNLDESLPDCPESTISHALRNNDDLSKPIIQWPAGDMQTLVTALREVIEEHRSKP